MSTALLHNFYTEISSDFNSENPGSFTSQIRLNPEHPIYKGHFEEVPITPGVCQMQIIKELIMNKFKVNLQLTGSDNLKFLAMNNPTTHAELSVKIDVKIIETTFEVNAVISHQQTTFTKFKGKFAIISA